MATAPQARRPSDTYLELVKEFRLVHIKDDAEMRAAHAMINRLLQEDLDASGQMYLDALTDLVEIYEDEHHQIPDASEADVLRELMSSNRLTQQKLAAEVGIAQSTISAVLSGARSLTLDQMIALGEFFHISAAVFLPTSATLRRQAAPSPEHEAIPHASAKPKKVTHSKTAPRPKKGKKSTRLADPNVF